MSSTHKTWLPEMEGLRGIASAWVFIGHICILIQCSIPIIGSPSYGVDLFIILSGFLMTKNYVERRDIEPWSKLTTIKNFWLRRFFRIAPLYYILLFIAVYFGPQIGAMRDIISEYYPVTATDTNRFNDQSLKNIIIHLSLLFGLSPEYSFRTTLPDWSIGLEIQYYLLFPILMIIAGGLGIKRTLVVFSLVSTLLFFLFPGFYKSFPMPSFILLKLPIFIAGMLLFIAIRNKKIAYLLLPIFVIFFASITHLYINKIQLAIQLGMCIFIYYTLTESQQNTHIIKSTAKRVLNNKFSIWLGDVSYSVYLIHLLIVTPVCAIVLRDYNLYSHPSMVRLIVVLVICSPIVYVLAHISYQFIEKPGISLGKKFIKKVK